MKKYLLAGLVAMVVLLAFPMAVSAANNTAVTVSGTIQLYIDVSVSPNSTQFFNMSALQTVNNSTAVVLTNTSSTGWNVRASDARGLANKGFMNTTPFANLTYPFQLSKDGSTYQPLTADYSNFMVNATYAGSFTQTVWQRQTIGVADPHGIYNIIVTFIGIAT